MKHGKPLWIPLKRVHFDEFVKGRKSIEYRWYGGQWTEKHIYAGRRAVLGCGYSGPRINAIVVKFEVCEMFSEIYGHGRHALIHLLLLGIATWR